MPAITGAHSIIYSKHPEADRAFLRDTLRLPNVDVGGGWLIFGGGKLGVYEPRHARARWPKRSGRRARRTAPALVRGGQSGRRGGSARGRRVT